MNQDIAGYYKKIDVFIATITDLAQQIINEVAKGEGSDQEKINQYQGGLKFILGTKSAVEVIAILVKVQAKLAESIAPKAQDYTLDEQNLKTTYLYFVARYENEELGRLQKCTECGAEQKLIEDLVNGKQPLTFKEFLDKVTNKT